MRPPVLRLLAASLGTLFVPAFATERGGEPDVPEISAELLADTAAFNTQVVQALIDGDTADGLIFAAQLLVVPLTPGAPSPVGTSPADLVHRATPLIGDDATTLWRLHGSCASFGDACDGAELLERLREVDAGNVWSWLHGLDEARDDAAIDDVLSRAAAADHASQHHLALWQRNATALSHVQLMPAMTAYLDDPRLPRQTPEDFLFMLAAALDFAHRVPRTSTTLRSTCMAAPTGTGRRDWCESIAFTLRARSDNKMDAMTGSRLELHLADDPETRAGVELACRRLHWLFEANKQAQAIVEDELDGTSVYARLLQQEGASELDAVRVFNAASGLPAEPPDTFATPLSCLRRSDEVED